MSATTPRRAPGGNPDTLWTAAAALGVAVLVGTDVPELLTGAALPPGLFGPFTLTGQVLTGALPWGLAQSLWAATLLAVLAALGGAGWWAWRAWTRPAARVDAAAAHLATRTDLAPLTHAGATAKARQLGAPTDPPGIYLGEAVGR